jgi:hypothetical protein
VRQLAVLLVALGVLVAPGTAGGQATETQDGPADLVFKEAKRISRKGMPYVYGGGHTKHPAGPRRVRGYDCSGATSRVLYRAGLLRRTRTASGFLDWGRRGSGEITVYASSGHVFLSVVAPSGRRFFFGTSSQNREGGPGFFHPSRSYRRGFTPRTVRVVSG